MKDTEQIIKSSNTLPPPPLTNIGKYFDSSCALLSRQFDRDRDRVIQRSITDNVSGILVWFSDVEKQSSILELCKNSIGHCYAAVGISPDNIDRTNKKMHSEWLLKIEELALSASCIAIITGLNLTKEMGTHFAQESLLKSCIGIADRLHLPLILHVGNDGASLERVFEILLEMGWIDENGIQSDKTIILYDTLSTCSGDISRVQNVVRNGFCCMISAAGLTDPNNEIQTTFQSCLQVIPISQMIACTDSPWKTPQNLPDVYLRTLRNEPCNMSSVIDAIAISLNQSKESISETIFQTTVEIFHIPSSTSTSQTENEQKESGNENEIENDREHEHQNENTKESSADCNENLKSDVPISTTPIPAPVPIVKSNECTRYNCVKCRRLIATSTTIVTHSVGASKTVFTIGQEGLCNSSIFIPYNPEELSHNNHKVGYKIEKENVHCVGCHAKFGRVSYGDATCGCGAIVSGPVLKINTAKLDQFLQDTDPLDTNQLSAILSRLEDQLGDDEDQTGNKLKSKKKKKSKQQKADNKGNFSSYRNKSFVPNASRKKKDVLTEMNDNEDNNSERSEEEEEEEGVEEEEVVTEKGEKDRREKSNEEVNDNNNDEEEG